MSGLEVIPLLIDVVPKTVAMARHIVETYKGFSDDRSDFEYRLNRQVSRLEDFMSYFSDKRISCNIKPLDNYSYYHIIERIHGLFVQYLGKSNDPNAKHVVDQYSAQETFHKIELLDEHMLNRLKGNKPPGLPFKNENCLGPFIQGKRPRN